MIRASIYMYMYRIYMESGCLIDFAICIVTISMGLYIVYFKGSQIEFSKLLHVYISVAEGCFCLSEQCRY